MLDRVTTNFNVSVAYSTGIQRQFVWIEHILIAIKMRLKNNF